jgi:hypothetical protein
MNEQYEPSYIVERTDQDMNIPAVNSDPFAKKIQVDAALAHETPIGETDAAVWPVSVPDAGEIPVYEPPVEEVHMETVTVVNDPVAEAIVHEAPMIETMPYKAPMDETTTKEAPIDTNAGSSSVALLDREESEHLRSRWNEIQGMFVDEPRSAVQQADALVSEVIEQITQMFTNEHSTLEGEWNQGNDVSTEDLRKSLKHYRSFFNRLVT